MYAYYSTLLLSVALRFGVIDELSRNLFLESPFLRSAARRALQGVAALLLLVSIVLAVYAHGDNNLKWIAGLSVVNRGAALVQSGLLLSLLLASRFLGLSWRRHAFGIALGLGILTSVDLAFHALRAEFAGNAWLSYLGLLTTGTYLVCVSIWIGYSLAPEPNLNVLAVVPVDEVEIWNTEFRRLLRD